MKAVEDLKTEQQAWVEESNSANQMMAELGAATELVFARMPDVQIFREI